MIVFCDTLGVYGGSQTLLLRMCTWLSENGYHVAIMCDDDSNEEIVSQLKKMEIIIVKVDIKNLRKVSDIIARFAKEDDIRAISFGWNNYIALEIAKKRLNIQFDNLLYCIHPDTLKRGAKFKNDLLKRYAKWTFGRMLNKMINNNAVIMMDEVNAFQAEEYFSLSVHSKVPIIRLPMICKEQEIKEEIIKKGYEARIIVTAARADFPMKGYLLGLLDDFSKLKKIYPELKLEIISAGDDLDILRKSIAESDVKDSIFLHGWMSYERLLSIIREGTVYIGMGTSVLDAALQYKPAIAVNFNTYYCYADGTIANLPEFIDTEDTNCTNPAIDILRKVLDFDYVQYRDESLNSFSNVKQVYDINNNLPLLINQATVNKGCILSGFEIVRQKINNISIAIRTRNKKAYSYSEIFKEPE